MRSRANERLFGASILALILLTLACGSSPSDGTAVAASATAARREEAIAQFTTEALNPTAVPTPRNTPVPTATPLPEPTAAATPTVQTRGADPDDPDRLALEALLLRRSKAFSTGDFDAWYATCSSLVGQRARTTDALGKLLRSVGREMPTEVAVEFIVEDVFLAGDTSATVIWSVRQGTEYFPGPGGQPYVKENGEWFSTGWGCI